MHVYRIDRVKYAKTVLSGEGAMLYGGRWNHINTRAVYASATRSLAMLEILAHVRQVGLVPKDRVIVTIDIPEKDIVSPSYEALPLEWNSLPDGPAGNKDLFENEVILSNKLCMQVPSVIMPYEYNFVLYPLAKSFSKVKVVNMEPLNWDYRL